MEKKRPVLSISMLVSNNRRDTIEKCMESLVPLRKAVPSELIIVDTGCTDGSVDIARKYADKVVQFTWCKDFSAARNAGLCECSGEWFLYLDDDEWFEDVAELITFFCGNEKNKYDAVWYIQRNYDNFEGTTYTDTRVSRIVKMTDETKFHGKIHEWLEPLSETVKLVNTYVHHYGYVYKTEEDRKKHLERNLTLEEDAVKENPDDIRMCCQLVQEYRAGERYEDAMRLCKETLGRTKYIDTNSFVQYLLVMVPKILIEQNKLKDALEEYNRLEKEKKLLHQTRRAIHCERAAVLGRLGRYEDAVKEYKNYFDELKWVPKVGDPVEYAVMDFEQYRSEYFIQHMAKGGIISMLQSKEFSCAEMFYDKVDWNYNKKDAAEMLIALSQSYVLSGEATLLQKCLPRVLECEDLKTQVYASLHSAFEQNPEKRMKMVKDLEVLERKDGNFSFFHLVHTENEGTTSENDLNDYFNKSDRKYDAEIMELFFTSERFLTQVLENITKEVYTEAVALLARKSEEEVCGLVVALPQLETLYPEEKVGFLYYANMVLTEKLLMFAEEKKQDVTDALKDYLYAVRLHSECLYHPTLLMVPNHPMLPANVRFALVMEQAEAVSADVSAWAELVKQAAKIYPVMVPVVKAVSEEKKNSGSGKLAKENAQSEILLLAEQLKGMVREQLDEGNVEEAKAVLSELSEMLPEDEEVKELLKGI